MSVTRRVPYFALIGALATIAAYPFGWYLYAFLFANILLVGFLLLDIMITPDGKIFDVTWATDAVNDDGVHLYVKAENALSFTVRNRSRFRLWVQALGGMGDAGRFFTTTKQDMTRFLNPNENGEFSYTVIPAKRGLFTFERVFLRYRGVLGFCVKHTSRPCVMPFKVYPNVRDLSKYRLMMQKSRLLPQGDKVIRQFGNGAEFESLRAYVEGDDYRKINWSATAREGKFIVNQYQIERNQPVYVLLDGARPMSYSVNGYKKLDYAINAALILCDIVNQQGDQAGLLAFDAKVTAHIKPGKGAGHRNTLMETLYGIEGNRQTANYEGAFRTLCERQKRRSLVFIFTDFEILEEAEELIAHIALLKKKHMPIVVFMANEGLQEMAQAQTHGRKDEILRDTAQEFLAERRSIFRKLNAMRIPNVESTAESFAISAVNRYMQIVRG
ncbi:MAG: DUF58 domain-containing protein [Defluviitaleaceae bacterium]|nr:DUF58 domain-containing protein [Defluviitaleaceae bacterium]MCL2261968.1 DUF58 domain-containing protein [Defluviitaleaceae bacterium]